MNKEIRTAFKAVKNTPTPENAEALATIAVPKFKEVYGRIQKAVRTVNRHMGVNKGNPNRATLATAIGLVDEVNAFKDVANILALPEMETAIDVALKTIETLADMRKNGKYEHIDVLADFYTNAENTEKDAKDAKLYLANITNAIRRAIDTINRHIVDGTFDVNIFKIAKAVGYNDEFPALRNRLTENDDIEAYDNAYKALALIIASKANGFTTAIPALNEYTPFKDEEANEEEVTEDTEDNNW